MIHPFDSFIGYIIVPAGIDAWQMARTLANGKLQFAISSSVAEQAGQLRAQLVDFSQPRVDLSNVAVSFNREIWVGAFDFVQSPQGPGNIRLAVRNITGAQPRPVIITGETIDQRTDSTTA